MRPSVTASIASLASPLRRRHTHEPLLAHQRLHNGIAAAAVADGHMVRLDVVQGAPSLKLLQDGLAGVAPLIPLVGPCLLVESAVQVHDVDGGQAMSLADLEVGRVVARGSPSAHPCRSRPPRSRRR